MPIKVAAASRRRNNLYAFCVIALSVTIVAVLAATVLSHFSSTSKGQVAGKKAISSLSGGFGCIADVTVDGTAYEVKLNKPVSGDSTMTFVKPASLSTLSFAKGADGVKVKLGSLEAAVDASSIPQTSIFNAVWGAFETCISKSVNAKAQGKDINLSGAFETCISKSVNAKAQGKDINLSGTSSVGAFTMVLDSTMKPKSLSIPTLKLTAKFKDFKYS